MRPILPILLISLTLASAFGQRSSVVANSNTGVLVEPANFFSANAGGLETALQSTAVGRAVLRLTDPSAITFLRLNADNSVTALGASDFRTAIGLDRSTYGAGLIQVADPASARAVLELGSMATEETTDYIATSYVTQVGDELLSAVDQASGRTALGLGTLATQSGTFAGTSSGTNTGDQTVTLTGAVTGTGTGSFATTLAADQARANLTGGSGALDLSVFTLTLPATLPAASGANLTALNATELTGTVPAARLTSANLPNIVLTLSGVLHNSPVTISSGAGTATLATQTANRIFAGPASGAAATPTFRALATADLPLVRQTFANADVTLSAGTTYLAQTGALSASREVTLPLANSVPAGHRIILADESGTATVSNTLQLVRAGSNIINGQTTLQVITSPYGQAAITSNGANDWIYDNTPSLPVALGLIAQTSANVIQARTLTGTANQITVTNGTGASGNPTISFPSSIIVDTFATTGNATFGDATTDEFSSTDDDPRFLHLTAASFAAAPTNAEVAINGSVMDARPARRAPATTQLRYATATLVAPDAIVQGIPETAGITGGFFNGAGTSASRILVSGQTVLNGQLTNNIYWNSPFTLYVRGRTILPGTNAISRVAVGLRTDTTQDLTTVSGTYAGIEWASNTSIRAFVANAGNAVYSSPVTIDSTFAADPTTFNLWIQIIGNGTINFYLARGFNPARPETPTITRTGASTTSGGSGFQAVLIGTGAVTSFPDVYIAEATLFLP